MTLLSWQHAERKWIHPMPIINSHWWSFVCFIFFMYICLSIESLIFQLLWNIFIELKQLKYCRHCIDLIIGSECGDSQGNRYLHIADWAIRFPCFSISSEILIFIWEILLDFCFSIAIFNLAWKMALERLSFSIKLVNKIYWQNESNKIRRSSQKKEFLKNGTQALI